jgi:hypothetical protein
MSQKEPDQTSSMVFPALNDVECREPPINRLKRDAKCRRPYSISSNPVARKRCFQRMMVGAVVPNLCLTVLNDAPSASIRISLARKTYPADRGSGLGNAAQFQLLLLVEYHRINGHTRLDVS